MATEQEIFEAARWQAEIDHPGANAVVLNGARRDIERHLRANPDEQAAFVERFKKAQEQMPQRPEEGPAPTLSQMVKNYKLRRPARYAGQDDPANKDEGQGR